jgi:hypothetical protein
MCIACMRIALAGDGDLRFEPEWPALAPRTATPAAISVRTFAAVEVRAQSDDAKQNRRGDQS